MNELISIINATDKDYGANSTIELLITASYLYKYEAIHSTGSLANSPFGMLVNPSLHCFMKNFMVHFLYVNFLCSKFIASLTAISQDGRLTTNAFMAEYNQDRFELEIQAKEMQPPERTTMAKVLVS